MVRLKLYYYYLPIIFLNYNTLKSDINLLYNFGLYLTLLAYKYKIKTDLIWPTPNRFNNLFFDNDKNSSFSKIITSKSLQLSKTQRFYYVKINLN